MIEFIVGAIRNLLCDYRKCKAKKSAQGSSTHKGMERNGH